jgi:hypothetical protein
VSPSGSLWQANRCPTVRVFLGQAMFCQARVAKLNASENLQTTHRPFDVGIRGEFRLKILVRRGPVTTQGRARV